MWVPLAVLVVLLAVEAIASCGGWWDARMRAMRPFILAAAAAAYSGVLVAIAVLVASVDATVWETIQAGDAVVEFVAAPTFTWFTTLSLAVWALFGVGFHAISDRPAVRRRAAAVAGLAAMGIPLTAPVVAYQMWRLVDAVIAAGVA